MIQFVRPGNRARRKVAPDEAEDGDSATNRSTATPLIVLEPAIPEGIGEIGGPPHPMSTCVFVGKMSRQPSSAEYEPAMAPSGWAVVHAPARSLGTAVGSSSE
jgi:hypothetical protein